MTMASSDQGINSDGGNAVQQSKHLDIQINRPNRDFRANFNARVAQYGKLGTLSFYLAVGSSLSPVMLFFAKSLPFFFFSILLMIIPGSQVIAFILGIIGLFQQIKAGQSKKLALAGVGLSVCLILLEIGLFLLLIVMLTEGSRMSR